MNHGIPPAELIIDQALLRSLLKEQHPDLAGQSLARIDNGWDNEMWRLGDTLCLRLPRRKLAVPLIENEQKWLPRLAPNLPIPVPAPVRTGHPGAGFPWPWSILPWLPGKSANQGWPSSDQAERFAGFLRALHGIPAAGAPANPARDQPLGGKSEDMAKRMNRLRSAGLWLTPGIEADWMEAVTAPEAEDSRFIHGDLHARNVLTDRGTISGVIDWGDMCLGDPAVDLAACWTLFEGIDARKRMMDAYGAGPELRLRAKGRAIFFGVLLLDSGLATGHAEQVQIGEAVLARVYQDR
jgi:aminoglycoside phosphotransferase (APT) family kinase protein